MLPPLMPPPISSRQWLAQTEAAKVRRYCNWQGDQGDGDTPTAISGMSYWACLGQNAGDAGADEEPAMVAIQIAVFRHVSCDVGRLPPEIEFIADLMTGNDRRLR